MNRKRPHRAGTFATIEEALQAIRAGSMVVVMDDEDRENEGDFVMAAEKVTPEDVNLMTREGRGLLCVSMPGGRLEELGLALMTPLNTARFATPFTVSVDLLRGTTTGSSAQDRALTIRALASPKTRPEQLARPGHVFPLRADDHGVLRRAGHTEAALDLVRLAGLRHAGVLCEILASNGSMARGPELIRLARKHRLPLVTIRDLVRYRYRKERMVKRIAASRLPTRYGDFRIAVYESQIDGHHHVALVKGSPQKGTGLAPLARVHSQCLTGDVFGSLRCDCGEQLAAALARIDEEGVGIERRGRTRQVTARLRMIGFQVLAIDLHVPL